MPSDTHHAKSAPTPPKEPQDKRTSPAPEKTACESPDKEDTRDSGTDTSASESEPESEASSEHELSPQPTSRPCFCRCGRCCCHGASTPQHCVRCHANYTLNHAEACTLPHVIDSDYRKFTLCYSTSTIEPSSCCGSKATVLEFYKGDETWDNPSACFVGWHTTDVRDVEKQYNGANVLRCQPSREGKCRRARMKYPMYYKPLYDRDVKRGPTDKVDYQNHLKRKREELEDEFSDTFKQVSDEESEGESEKEGGEEDV